MTGTRGSNANVSQWRAAVRSALDDEASDETKRWAEKYFRGAIQFIGVTGPKVKAIERALRSAWRHKPVDEQGALGFALQTSKLMEERQVGQLVLDRVVQHLDANELIDALEPIFDKHVRDWATCDALAGRVLRRCLVDTKARKRIIAWSRAKGEGATWKQRASAVAFVNEARHGTYDDDIIAVCARIVKNPERFVQLGCGWVLRELSLADRARVLTFLEDNARFISSEGFRYATEKLPASVKAAAKAKRTNATS